MEMFSEKKRKFLLLSALKNGELPEWSIGADSKSVVPFGVPGVRIPRSPQKKSRLITGFLLYDIYHCYLATSALSPSSGL